MDDCHDNAVCTDTDGLFTCACKSGYSGDGKTCTSKWGLKKVAVLLSGFSFFYGLN